MLVTAPDRTEAADFYWTYISKVEGGDIIAVLERQLETILPVLDAISEERSLYRYAPGKWSIRQLLSHVNDTERLFSFRAFWFARGLPDPLPTFDENAVVPLTGAEERSWASHVEELKAIRGATLALFRGLPDDAWLRRGTASGHSFTPRALAYICAGHVTHHMRVLQELYRAS
jgi:hypothetical protein